MGDGKPRVRYQEPRAHLLDLMTVLREQAGSGVLLMLRGMAVEVYSTLPQGMVPELLRAVADRIEQDMMEEGEEKNRQREPVSRHG